MQAVILAAGRGKRLAPLTDKTPKPMVKLLGQPLIAYALDALPSKVEEIIIVVGYKGAQIRAFVGASWRGIPVRYVEQKKPAGTYDALLRAKKLLRGRFIVAAADVLYSKKDMARLASHPLSILVRRDSAAALKAGLCIVKNGRLVELLEDVYARGNTLRNCAAYCLDKRIFAQQVLYGPSGESWLSPMVGTLGSDAPVYAVVSTFHATVSRPADVALCEKKINAVPSMRPRTPLSSQGPL